MPLDFVREPAPRLMNDYTARRREQSYMIWRATGPEQFGLSITGLRGEALKRWQSHCRGRGILWLHTKRNCEKLANEIADLQEAHYADPRIKPLR